MTTFLLLLKYFFWSVLYTLLQVVFLSVTKLLLEYNFRVLFTPLAITGQDLPYGPVPGALRSDGKTLFLVYTYVWQEDVAKIFKVPGASRNVNTAWAITW